MVGNTIIGSEPARPSPANGWQHDHRDGLNPHSAATCETCCMPHINTQLPTQYGVLCLGQARPSCVGHTPADLLSATGWCNHCGTTLHRIQWLRAL